MSDYEVLPDDYSQLSLTALSFNKCKMAHYYRYLRRNRSMQQKKILFPYTLCLNTHFSHK